MPQEPLTIIVEGNLIPNRLSSDGILSVPGTAGGMLYFSTVGKVAVELANQYPNKTVQISVNTNLTELECYKVYITRIGHIRYSLWRIWDKEQNRFRFRVGDVGDTLEEEQERVFDTQGEARYRLQEILASHLTENGAESFNLVYHPFLEAD